jgi:hypothetical protein
MKGKIEVLGLEEEGSARGGNGGHRRGPSIAEFD